MNDERKIARAAAALGAVAFLMLASGCASKVMKADNSQQLLKNDEFDKAIQVQTLPPTETLSPSGTYVVFPGPAPVPGVFPPAPPKKKPPVAQISPGRKQRHLAPVNVATAAPVPVATPLAHEPAIEDGEGFEGRRPKVDPFRVGEKVTLDVSYFGVSAGDMTIEVRPFAQVNGRRSYNFAGTAISTSVFAMFYAVDDWFETFVDYETLTPSNYALHVKESKQLRETRALFDWPNMKATWWDKKIDSDKNVEERKKEWEIAPFSQNIFTAVYYLRTFQLKPGKKLAFRVAHEGENLIVTGEVVRREKVSTPAGDFNTVVVKPKIELNGAFKPVGDIFIWLTDDERKFVVRIESKIKIGTIVGALKKIERGAGPQP